MLAFQGAVLAHTPYLFSLLCPESMGSQGLQWQEFLLDFRLEGQDLLLRTQICRDP